MSKKDFCKRWNVEYVEDSFKEFQKLKVRIENTSSTYSGELCLKLIHFEFCKKIGLSIESSVYYYLTKTSDEAEYFWRLENILNILNKQAYSAKLNAPFIKDRINHGHLFLHRLFEAIDISCTNLGYSSTKEGEIILHPKGEKLLDKELIENALNFLNEASTKHFIDALKFFEKSPIKSVESIRRCIEEFLRYKIKNKQGLVANIKNLQEKLKVDQKSSQIRNIIFQIFSYLDMYFNDNSKHNDGEVGKAENEFIIYQGALLMRYVNEVVG